jgi:hypothetical protein
MVVALPLTCVGDRVIEPISNQTKHLHSASSMKQQSTGRHVAPLGHIVLVASQTFLVLTP